MPLKNMILHHYTPLEKLELILKSRKLRFSNFQNMNDSEEFSYGLGILYPIFKKEVKRLGLEISDHDIKSEFRSIVNLFIKSLTTGLPSFLFCLCHIEQSNYTNLGLLSMWRSYANDGRGVALEFNTKDFINDVLILEEEIHLKLYHKVKYKSDILSFENMLTSVLKKSQTKKNRCTNPKKAISDSVILY